MILGIGKNHLLRQTKEQLTICLNNERYCVIVTCSPALRLLSKQDHGMKPWCELCVHSCSRRRNRLTVALDPNLSHLRISSLAEGQGCRTCCPYDFKSSPPKESSGQCNTKNRNLHLILKDLFPPELRKGPGYSLTL